MDALRNSKKINLLAVAILFLFTFFNLILDAPFRITYHEEILPGFFLNQCSLLEAGGWASIPYVQNVQLPDSLKIGLHP